MISRFTEASLSSFKVTQRKTPISAAVDCLRRTLLGSSGLQPRSRNRRSGRTSRRIGRIEEGDRNRGIAPVTGAPGLGVKVAPRGERESPHGSVAHISGQGFGLSPVGRGLTTVTEPKGQPTGENERLPGQRVQSRPDPWRLRGIH